MEILVSDKEIFDTFLDDVMNMRMSVHAFGLVARNVFEKMENQIEARNQTIKYLETEICKVSHVIEKIWVNPSTRDEVKNGIRS
jgi:hypothetical protein